MKRVAGALALILAVTLLGTSDVQGGFAGGAVGKTSGPTLTATIVADLTGPAGTAGKGLTAIRVQKAGSSAAVLFVSNTINQSAVSCEQILQEMQGGFNRFVGKVDLFVAPFSVRDALLGQFGDPEKAAIADTDYASCTTVDRSGVGTDVRDILSLTAVIQFEK